MKSNKIINPLDFLNNKTSDDMLEIYNLRTENYENQKRLMNNTRNQAYMIAAKILDGFTSSNNTDNMAIKARKSMIAQQLRQLCDNMTIKMTEIDNKKAKLIKKKQEEKKLIDRKIRDTNFTAKDIELLTNYEHKLQNISKSSQIQFNKDSNNIINNHDKIIQILGNINQFKENNNLYKRQQYELYLQQKQQNLLDEKHQKELLKYKKLESINYINLINYIMKKKKKNKFF